MISHPKNRVQAIKSKFENLNTDPPLAKTQLFRIKNESEKKANKENSCENKNLLYESDLSSDECVPNHSYLYKNEVKRSVSDSKAPLSRQTSDPSKKLHRSHAFRCERTQLSPKRHGSNRSINMERKLSSDRLKKLGDFLEEHMRRDNFVATTDPMSEVRDTSPVASIPDDQVPPHILAQYAKVIKPKRSEDKQDAMTDSGVSSETENLDDERSRVKRLTSQFEPDKTEKHEKTAQNPEIPESTPKSPELPALDTVKTLEQSNLNSMEDLASSTETMRFERKNPHLILTDTLKKALKQPLPPGPPPKKPPRSLNNTEKDKTDTKRKLEKLEQVLKKRETEKKDKNIYDIAEENLSLKKPKEIHYLCTEILDITQRTLLPNTTDQNQNTSPLKNCFGKLNCTLTNSMSSLPYSRLSNGFESNRNSCSYSHDNLTSDNGKGQGKDEGFVCHLKSGGNGQSAFYVDSHIYDVPFECSKDNKYGTLNTVKVNGASKSLEDLRILKITEETPIYETPCERASTPIQIQKTDFQKLVENFENGSVREKKSTHNKIPENFQNTLRDAKITLFENKQKDVTLPEGKLMRLAKSLPPFNPEINLTEERFTEVATLKEAKSTENLDKKYVKRTDNKFATEGRRGRIDKMALKQRNTAQLDVDRENLNRLMDEIYDTVTAACSMAEQKPGSFPTDQSDGSTSEDSVKLTRSLTEKRKNYVRRVSSRLAYLEPKNIKNTRYRHQTSICSYKSEIIDNPYSTFRSWKSFRASQNNLNSKMESPVSLTDDIDSSVLNDSDSLDEKAGCVDIDLPFEARENSLFNVCLLVGLNYMTGQAYVKSVFPSQVKVPQHIENLIFPETFSQDKGDWTTDAKSTQCYSFVLTDERGERSYGYCRRVLPEGATTCLPLCYCIIGKYRAPGFYYKVLKEIESHHGSSEIESNIVLQKLFESDFPNPGECITISYNGVTNNSSHLSSISSHMANTSSQLSDEMKCKTMPELRSLDDYDECCDNNNVKVKTIQRHIESRGEDTSMCCLLDACGAGVVVKMFATLLLERKLIIRADTLSTLSQCMEGVQTSVYPFVWQQPLISCAPAALARDVGAAPLPLLAGLLHAAAPAPVEEGMLVDLTHTSKILYYQGDETTILPTNSYKTLKTALQMETIKNNKDETKTRNVMISEAFLRFFVDILGDFWKYFSFGEKKETDLGKGNVIFDKENFIKNASTKQNQYFLEWFIETAMFNHFIQNMAVRFYYKNVSQIHNNDYVLIDTPYPNFYQLFEERVQARLTRNNVDRSGYKSALNKRVKLLKARLKELVG